MVSFILVNSSGHRVEIEEKWCHDIGLLANLVKLMGDSNDVIEVPVYEKITSGAMDNLKIYLQLLEKNQEKLDKKPTELVFSRNDKLEIETPDFMLERWEQTFVDKLDGDSLHNLMIAANYLDIPKLLDLCTTTVANMIRNETPEKIREILGIKCDLSQEEVNRIEMENVWLSD